MKTAIDIILLAYTGANFIVEASVKTIVAVLEIVDVAVNFGGHVTLKKCEKKLRWI